MPLGKQKINRRFPAHIPLEEADVLRRDSYSSLYREFASYLDDTLSDGRLKSLALTKLEESHTYTIKAVEAEVDSARYHREKQENE